MNKAETKQRGPAGLQIVVLGLAFLFSFAALYLIWRNFTEGGDPTELIGTRRILDPLWRSVSLALAVSATTAAIGTALAWLTSRTDLPGNRIWRVVLPIPLVFPTFIGAAAFIRTMNPGGLANRMLSGLGIETVDVGAAMLAMHSIRETCGSLDADYLIKAFQAIYQEHLPILN